MLLYLTSDFVFISPRSTYLGSSVGYLDYGLWATMVLPVWRSSVQILDPVAYWFTWGN